MRTMQNISHSETLGDTVRSEQEALRTRYTTLCERLENDPLFVIRQGNSVKTTFEEYFQLDREEAQRVVSVQDARYEGFLMRRLRLVIEPFERSDVVIKYKCAKKALGQR